MKTVISTAYKDNKETRQSLWKDPSLFKAIQYTLLRLFNNQANKAEFDCLKLGNTYITDLTGGTLLIGDVHDQVWQTIESFYIKGKKTDNCSNKFENRLGSSISAFSIYSDQSSIYSDHYQKVLFIKNLKALSTDQLFELQKLIVQSHGCEFQVFIGVQEIADFNYKNLKSRRHRLMREIIYSCINMVVFNCEPETALQTSNILGHRKMNRLLVDSGLISSLPDRYFFLSKNRFSSRPLQPILCQLQNGF